MVGPPISIFSIASSKEQFWAIVSLNG